MMDLDEAIQHCEEVADTPCFTDEEARCYVEHRQLAKWLKELKAYRENTCDDAISRQAVLKIIDGWYDNNRDTENIEDLIVLITYMSSVIPQQRTGRWIEVIDETDSLGNKTWHHECSICGSDKSGWGTYKHCPDCGAKMEVEE